MDIRGDGPGGATGVGRYSLRLCGIYKLDGEKLVVCLPEEQVSPLLRPTDFKGDGEGGLYLLTYQRATKAWKGEKAAPPPPTVAMDPGLADDRSPLPPPAATSDVRARPEPLPPASIPAGPLPGVGLPVQGPVPISPVDVGLPVPSIPVQTAPVGGPIAPVADPFVPTTQAPAVSPTINLPMAPDRPPQKTEATATPTSDLDRLQGVWVITQEDGKPLSPDAQRQEALEFLKDRVLSADGTHGRVRLDEAKAPPQITLGLGKPGEPPMTGIYKLEGDRLVIASCTKSPKLIPTTFESDPDAGICVIILERQKSPPPAPSTPADTPKTDSPRKPPARDLQKEIDQLREQLKRLEKELKDRTD
jgi:uncharacterized protein (TIGR03067 family)